MVTSQKADWNAMTRTLMSESKRLNVSNSTSVTILIRLLRCTGRRHQEAPIITLLGTIIHQTLR